MLLGMGIFFSWHGTVIKMVDDGGRMAAIGMKASNEGGVCVCVVESLEEGNVAVRCKKYPNYRTPGNPLFFLL